MEKEFVKDIFTKTKPPRSREWTEADIQKKILFETRDIVSLLNKIIILLKNKGQENDNQKPICT